MMKKLRIISVVFLMACGGNEYVPKPKAYPKIDFPDRAYARFEKEDLPYSFDIAEYVLARPDTLSNFQVKDQWYNLYFKPFDATLHLTYHKIHGPEGLDSLIYDTRKFVNKQIDRAQDIGEIPIQQFNPSLDGIYFDIMGYTATNLNFYITDNTQNFVRGALYFNYSAQSDSVAPIYSFMKADVKHLIQSFKWKK